MGTFKISCKKCGQKLEADESWIGMEADCPQCGSKITIKKEQTVSSIPKLKIVEDEAAENPTIRFNVPCLTVNRGSGRGNIRHLPFSFQKTNEDKPLRIMITDDTPDGSGKEIRNNLWLAAITAAMLRNATMHGVKISAEFQGNVDGPSAGAVSCIAILSAMDGLDLPDDFAMTGAIFPDGTIGPVGGMVEKIKAAAADGKKRVFVPGYHRMVEDVNENLVDLIGLAEDLKISLFMVENIEDAFALIHGNPVPERSYIDAKQVTALPRKVENLFIKEYQKYKERIELLLNNFSPEEILDIYKRYKSLFKYDDLFIEGKFVSAFSEILSLYQILTAEHKIKPLLRQWTAPIFGSASKKIMEIHQENMAYLETKVRSMWKKHEVEQKNGFVPANKELSPIAAQFEDSEKFYALLGLFNLLEDYQCDEKISDEEFDELRNIEILARDIAEIVDLPEQKRQEFYAEIASNLPSYYPVAAAAEVEQLFKTAQEATFLVALSCAKEEAGIDAFLAMSNKNFADSCHEKIAMASSPEYHTQVALKSYVSAFTASATWLIDLYDGCCSNNFPKYLVMTARESALHSIKTCVDAGIPCLDAISNFHLAENEDDWKEELNHYWYAGLYAKALLISFKGGRSIAAREEKVDRPTYWLDDVYNHKTAEMQDDSYVKCPRCQNDYHATEVVHPISYGSVRVVVCKNCFKEYNKI